MAKALCFMFALLFSIVTLAQKTGTLNIEKPHAPEILDTIEVMLGAPEYFKPIKVRYKPGAHSKAVVFKDYSYRKKVPSAIYRVTYPETGSMHSTGEIKDGKMHGKWQFHTIAGDKITYRKFDNGELIKGSKVVMVGE